ncbi:twin-arginine translocase subunit TatC [Frondihabitans cladoniiphilus]|uniref:Sec-independent protein translocase protein TatC n=1 Tax=Frondihabitans cladoniiphilus TaxID=715785 RepID=A0ABP8W8V3_9MICO
MAATDLGGDRQSQAPKPARDASQMSLGSHLVELRKRAVRIALGIVLGAVAGWFLSDYVLVALSAPVQQLANSNHEASLNYGVVTGAFDLKITISITIGVVISSPVWLYQIWAFVVPALVRKEKLYALGFLLTAIPLFLIGCAGGFYVFPHIVQVMTSFVSAGSSSIIDAKQYYSFVLKLVLAVGVAFVLPVFLVLLNFIGVVSAAAIIKGWRIAIICIVVFSALVTPSADVFSMVLLAIPMVILYLVACVVSWIHDRRAAKRAAALDAALDAEVAGE